METNSVNWFEIPVEDLDRAAKFYELILDTQLHPMEMPGMAMRVFPEVRNAPFATGCLYHSEQAKPSAEGTTVYFSCPNIELVCERIASAGGQVIMPKTSIGEFGFIAQFMDTEGNRVALHAEQ